MATKLTVLVLFGFFLAAAIPAAAQLPGKKQAADVATIQRVVEQLDAAYDRRDADAFCAFFLPDADFQWHTGEVMKDREAIRQHFAQAFKVMPADYRHITDLTRIRFLAPDIGIGDGIVLIARAGAADNERQVMKVLMTGVAKKENGQWRIAAIRLIPIIANGTLTDKGGLPETVMLLDGKTGQTIGGTWTTKLE
jgi:uncharacterized protein (TIGR02246 family)